MRRVDALLRIYHGYGALRLNPVANRILPANGFFLVNMDWPHSSRLRTYCTARHRSRLPVGRRLWVFAYVIAEGVGFYIPAHVVGIGLVSLRAHVKGSDALVAVRFQNFLDTFGMMLGLN